jgi:Virulence factor BrkB
MSYGIDPVDEFRQAATYVDRILRGAKPADLPVQAPTKYEPENSERTRPDRTNGPATIFFWYAENFGNYNKTYGSLGAIIAFMFWMWLSIIVVLLGAELNAETEHQTARDTTTGRPKPLGSRGAKMADTVGGTQD